MHAGTALGVEDVGPSIDGTSDDVTRRHRAETAIWRAAYQPAYEHVAMYHRRGSTRIDVAHAVFAARGFAASALVHDVRAFASSAIPPVSYTHLTLPTILRV